MKGLIFYISVFCVLIFQGGCKDDEKEPEPTPTPVAVRSPKVYVVLGSSTAEGVGPGPYDSSWVGRSISYLRANDKFKGDTIINLARGGYTSFDIMPTGDKNRNITKALSHQPYAIIVNMPSNDIANGRTVEDQMNNFAALSELTKQQKVVLWVTTAQPRDLNEDGRRKLIELKDRINAVYGEKSIDFWTDIANQNGTINTKYNAGDGIHINSNGHKILFSRTLEKKVFN